MSTYVPVFHLCICLYRRGAATGYAMYLVAGLSPRLIVSSLLQKMACLSVGHREFPLLAWPDKTPGPWNKSVLTDRSD